MDFLAIQHGERFMEVVYRSDDFVARIAEYVFIIERGQRFVLHDEDPLDDLLTLPEQHLWPQTMTSPSQRTTKRRVPPRRNHGRAVPAAPQKGEGGPQRIAKLLARAGVASRREVERMIAEGRVALNGEKLTTPATLLEDLTGVSVDGKPVRPAAGTRLFRFYKPPVTLTAERDPKGRPTIYDRL